MTISQSGLPVPQPLLSPAVSKAKQVILTELPDFWPRIEACFATSAAMRLADLDLCPTLILTGPSGCGKSAVIDMLDGSVGMVRVDSITAACFVSSSSNQSREELKQVDLLPKIRHKTMLTRDLSTVFRKNTDQLKDLFGVLIPVLDGKGYVPASGTQGLRGDVSGEHIFCWIAATTPFPPQTWDTQKRFGSRLLHYDLFTQQMTDEQILAEREGKTFGKKIAACKDVAATVLTLLTLRRSDGGNTAAPRSVSWGDDPQAIKEWRVKLARLLVACRRRRGNIEEDEEDSPHRVITQLEALTRGRAMLEDRTVVTAEDLPLAIHAILSSSRHGRVLRAVAQNPAGLTVDECKNILCCSQQTATNRMEAFVRETDGTVVVWDTTSSPKRLVPVQAFSWLCDVKGLGWL
jgi:energy-coupling factor transporter ATP-binding protein EcfA2